MESGVDASSIFQERVQWDSNKGRPLFGLFFLSLKFMFHDTSANVNTTLILNVVL